MKRPPLFPHHDIDCTLLLLLMLFFLLFGAPVSEAGATAPSTMVSAPIAPYDQEAYELAFEVFLANGKLENAYRLSLAAVRERPRDIGWRKRLVQTATWTNRPDVVLEQWIVISESETGTAALDDAIRMAKALGKPALLKKLLERKLKKNPSRQDWIDYLGIAETEGTTDEAFEALAAAAVRNADPFVLEQLSRLAEHKGDLSKALRYLEIAAEKHGISVAIAMEQARISYGRGDIASALKYLLTARFIASPDDTLYWQTLGDLAWSMQDIETSLYAGWLLISRNRARSDDLERMVIMLRESEPEQAYTISRIGWVKYRTASFFLGTIDIGVALKRWDDLNDLYRELTAAERESLDAIPYVWVCRIQVNEARGRKSDSPAIYRQALERFPDNEELVAGYIWSLLDQRDRATLSAFLASSRGFSNSAGVLRAAIGSAYAFLDEHDAALPYFEADEKERATDLLWMASYADLLERAGKTARALEIRKRAWGALADPAGQDRASPGARDRLAAAVRLAMKVAPGDTADRLAALFTENATGGADAELIILWALSTGREELARAWTVKQLPGGRYTAPPWIALTIALRDNDREKITALLETDADDIPLRDRIEAHRRIGEPSTALVLSWQALEANPDDLELLRQYADFAVPAGDRLELLSSIQDRGVLVRHISGIAAGYHLVPSLMIRPSAQFITQRVSGTDPANAPRSDNAGEIAVQYTGSFGTLELAAGARSAVADFPTFRLKGERKPDDGIGFSLSAAYGIQAPESIPLLIGGVKDELSAEVSWRVSGSDNLSFIATGQRFRDQDGNELGSGQRISAGYGSRIEATNPGLEIYSTIISHQLSASGMPGARAATLIPPGQVPSSGYFMPRSFVQWEAGIFTDRSFLSRYSRPWKPYAGVGVALNSVSSVGYNGEIGASGPLFGHDTLSVSLRMGSDSFGGSDSSFTADIWYTYHLSP